MKTFERVSWVLIIIGIFLKLLHLTGSNEMILLGSLFLAIFYVILGVPFFNGVPLKGAFSKASYSGVPTLGVWAALGLGIGMGLFSLGMGCRLLLIPIGSTLLISGAILIALMIGLLKMQSITIPRSTFLRCGFALTIAGLLFFTPTNTLIRTWHHDQDPVFVEKVIYVHDHPEDTKAREELEEMRRRQ